MKKLIWYISDFFAGANKHHVSMYSAASAYFIFICVIPFLTILLYLVPYTFIEKETVVEMASSLMPSFSSSIIISLIDELYNRTSAILPVSIVVMFWTASGSMVSLRNGLNDINEVSERKNFLLVRLIATAYTVLSLIVIIFISLLSIFGETLLNFIESKHIRVINFLTALVDYRVLITILGFFIAFMILYSYLPAKNNKLYKELLGAIIASVTCFAFSKIFNYLVNNYLSFSMYGSLAAIVVIMMYFYWFFYIFFLGAYLNAYISKGPHHYEV